MPGSSGPHQGLAPRSLLIVQGPRLTALLGTPRYNSAKKDNDFIYHEAVPALDTLQPVKGPQLRGGGGSGQGCSGGRPRGRLGVCMGLVSTTFRSLPGAPLVKPLPVNPTDPAVTGPDIFAKLVPMAAHEASSLYRWVGGTGPALCTGGVGMSQDTGFRQLLCPFSHSEEKAKLLREMMAKIEDKNEVLE